MRKTRHKSQIRYSRHRCVRVELRNEVMESVNIVPGKIGERNCIDNYTSDENILYLFEKGYYKYSWYDDMSKNNRI